MSDTSYAIDFGLNLLWTQALLRDAKERIEELEAENKVLRAELSESVPE